MYVFGSPARLFQVFVLALVTLAIPARLFAQTPTFDTVVMTPTGSAPWQPPRAAAVGDFNADGKLDAVIVDGSDVVRFMRGNGNGTFTRSDIGLPGVETGNVVGLPASLAPYLPRPIASYLAGRAADVNGDGRLDVISVSRANINWGNYGFASILINTGNLGGVPQFAVTHYFLPYWDVRSLTVGDLNGDGKPDYVVGSAYGGLNVYLNNGSGIFAAGQSTNVEPIAGGPAVGPGVIKDVNGDGKADFVVTSNQAGATNVFIGNGNGALQTPPAIIPNYAVAIAVADVNADAKPDLVLGFGDGSVSVALGNGNGTFGSAASFSTVAGGNVSGLFVADVNGDGKMDVGASLYSAGKVAILPGNGDGTFGAASLFSGVPNAMDVTLDDFTGDGKHDIASVSANGYGGQNYAVLTNTTVFPPPAAMFFTDALTGPGSPNLGPIPAGKYGYTTSGLQRTQSSSTTDRPMVRTAVGTYLTASNFTAEVTINLTSPDIAYFGLGQTDPDPNYFNEPTPSFLFRVHRYWTGYSGIQAWPTKFASSHNNPDHFFGFPAGNALPNYPGGPLTLVINKNGDTLTMSIPSMGASKTFSISQYSAAMGLNGTNTRIFLGNTTAGSVFSNLKIYEASPDTTAPVISGPADIVAEATGPGGAEVTFTATAEDDVDGAVDVVADPDSGSQFPIGDTTVELSATDAAGNDATASFTVTVRDTIAPAITSLPAPQTIEATSAAGAVVTFGAAVATDAVGVASLTYSNASGSTFPLGTTTVTVTATDAAGNSRQAAFTVTVVDTTPPAITSVSSALTVEATSAAGAIVTYAAATATDAVGVASITYSKASGTTFQIGATTVTVTATDAAGNASSAQFVVTVRDTTAPALGSVAPSQATLWQPNHQMVAIDVTAVATDAVGVTSLKIIDVTSSEPDNGLGDGDTGGDIVITGALSVNLRAERSGRGNGRTYTITVEARDAAGNASTKTCTVVVPKSRAR